jgi:hypothetical protein
MIAWRWWRTCFEITRIDANDTEYRLAPGATCHISMNRYAVQAATQHDAFHHSLENMLPSPTVIINVVLDSAEYSSHRDNFVTCDLLRDVADVFHRCEQRLGSFPLYHDGFVSGLSERQAPRGPRRIRGVWPRDRYRLSVYCIDPMPARAIHAA